MSYKARKYVKSTIKSIERLEGEPIEHKVERILNQGETIKDGAPVIFTEKKEGVISAYNIRTDRWEIATDAMDAVHRSKTASRDATADAKLEVVKEDIEDKSAQGKESQKIADSKG